MDPTEKIIRTLDGEVFDHVPTFCAGIEDRTFQDVLGKPKLQNEKILQNRLLGALLNKWGPSLTKPILQPFITQGMEKRIEAAVKLGFDATWGIYDETFIARDAKTMYRYTGSLFELRPDGFGNMTYFYIEPAIHSRQEYLDWPYWPDPKKLAQKTYKFYKKMVEKYGTQICIMGQGPHYGIFESLLWTLGFGRLAKWFRKEPDLIQDFIDKTEEICHRGMMAMMDAGIKVIFQSDDMCFKTGPMLSPKLIEKWFGPSYSRLTQAVHDRGGKYIQHSCGDNTELFGMFIDWGIDGVHSLENTSSVNFADVKKRYGDRLTFMGGVGIDHLLTENSTKEEVQEGVRDLIRLMAPNGRFIIGPVHSEATTPGHKLTEMLQTVQNIQLVSQSIPQD